MLLQAPYQIIQSLHRVMWLYGVLSTLYTIYQNMVEAARPCTDAVSSWQLEENCSIELKFTSRLSFRQSQQSTVSEDQHFVDITYFRRYCNLSNEQRA